MGQIRDPGAQILITNYDSGTDTGPRILITNNDSGTDTGLWTKGHPYYQHFSCLSAPERSEGAEVLKKHVRDA